MSLVDTHCHLDDRQFEADRDEVIERALAAGVWAILTVGTDDGPPDLEAGVRLAEAWPFIYATVGVHPHDASKATPETFQRLQELLSHEKVVALGEIGLDYHYNFSPPDAQRAVFAEQLRLARDARKPVVIHTREAWDDTMALLGEHSKLGGAGGIMHCFSGGSAQARQVLDMGFHLSFTGIVTYPKADSVRRAALLAPLDRLLVETDAPYLAPQSRRGKRNEPAFVVETARRLAELRGEPFGVFAAATSDNFRRLCLQPVQSNG